MTSIYGNNPEKKCDKFLDVYFIALVIGALFAIALVALALGARFFVGVAIKYWIWVIALFAGGAVVRHFMYKRRKL